MYIVKTKNNIKKNIWKVYTHKAEIEGFQVQLNRIQKLCLSLSVFSSFYFSQIILQKTQTHHLPKYLAHVREVSSRQPEARKKKAIRQDTRERRWKKKLSEGWSALQSSKTGLKPSRKSWAVDCTGASSILLSFFFLFSFNRFHTFLLV